VLSVHERSQLNTWRDGAMKYCNLGDMEIDYVA
jgi:hypothetical protein